MIELPAGDHEVLLSYPGPLTLRLAFWFCLTAWGVWAVLLLRSFLGPVGTPLRFLTRLGQTGLALIAVTAIAVPARLAWNHLNTIPYPARSAGIGELSLSPRFPIDGAWQLIWQDPAEETSLAYSRQNLDVRFRWTHATGANATSSPLRTNYLREQSLRIRFAAAPSAEPPQLTLNHGQLSWTPDPPVPPTRHPRPEHFK
jgi:hypothetical protein